MEISEEPDTKTIIIVLESPHKDEFNILKSVDEIVNSNPALGRTGRMLEKYFTKDNLEKKLKEDHICDEKEQKYRVILMNSIQYQCSLGASPELFRDKIWFRLWFEKNFYEDFMDRLKRYEPDIIINLCTKIKFTKEQIMNIDDKDLKEKLLKGDLWNARSIVAFYINKVIDEKKEIIVYEGNHPAGWSENFDSIHLVF